MADPAPAARRTDGAAKCPTCEAAGTEAWIIFVPVANNAGRKLKSMPLNADPDPAGNVIVTRLGTGALRARVATKGEKAVPPEVTYCPHFATCVDPGAHRRRQQRGNWTSAVNARNADQRRGRARAAPPDIGPGQIRLYPGDHR